MKYLIILLFFQIGLYGQSIMPGVIQQANSSSGGGSGTGTLIYQGTLTLGHITYPGKFEDYNYGIQSGQLNPPGSWNPTPVPYFDNFSVNHSTDGTYFFSIYHPDYTFIDPDYRYAYIDGTLFTDVPSIYNYFRDAYMNGETIEVELYDQPQ